MPTFAPPELRPRVPRAYRRRALSGVAARAYFHFPRPSGPVRHRNLAGLALDPPTAFPMAPSAAPGISTQVFLPPPPPPGWDTSNPGAAPPAPLSPSVPANANAGPVTLPAGTILTYSVTYALTGLGNFFTSNQDAIGTAAEMLAGVGLSVVNQQTPASANPFSNNSAVLTLQVTGAGFASITQAKALADNAFAAGVGSQVISSSLTQGAPNQAMTWLSQNWPLLAAGVLGILILPKILGDVL